MRSGGRQLGSALVAVVAIGVLMTTTVYCGLTVLAAQASVSRQESRADEARELAEAGLQWAIARIEGDRTFQGERAHAFGAGPFDVAVEEVPGQPHARRIRVVGRVPAPKGLFTTSTYVGVLERVETPRGLVWRRLSWRLVSR